MSVGVLVLLSVCLSVRSLCTLPVSGHVCRCACLSVCLSVRSLCTLPVSGHVCKCACPSVCLTVRSSCTLRVSAHACRCVCPSIPTRGCELTGSGTKSSVETYYAIVLGNACTFPSQSARLNYCHQRALLGALVSSGCVAS